MRCDLRLVRSVIRPANITNKRRIALSWVSCDFANTHNENESIEHCYKWVGFGFGSDISKSISK